MSCCEEPIAERKDREDQGEDNVLQVRGQRMAVAFA